MAFTIKGGAFNQFTVEEGWVEDTSKAEEEIKPNSSPERINYEALCRGDPSAEGKNSKADERRT